MILVGNQRGGGKDLALHLLKDENDHIEVHEVRGFGTESLVGALNEAYALSRGTRCKQFLYSLSLNPPAPARVETPTFLNTIERIEKSLGLTDQPRAIVFHEKQGRRHAHVVWSRINTDEMKAVQLSYTKNRLRAMSRELFLEHGWQMPRGLVDSDQRDPRNFTLAQWQQAKRIGKDPRAVKTALQDAWAISDSKAAFIHALEERGYRLARGDRRCVVAVDWQEEVYSIPKWADVKTKQVRERVGPESELPSVTDVKAQIADDMAATVDRLASELDERAQQQLAAFERRRQSLVRRQRRDRDSLRQRQESRNVEETRIRQARFRRGLKGLWDRLTGEHKRIRKENECEAEAAKIRDRHEKDAIVFRQLEDRRLLRDLNLQSIAELTRQKRDLLRDKNNDHRPIPRRSPQEQRKRTR